MVWNGTEISVWNMEDARMEWKTIFHTSIPIPYWISLMVFTEKYMQIVITKNIRKRLTANHLSTN